MTLPGFGVMTLSGFIYPWLLLLAAVPAVLAGLYVANQIQRRRRLERFADPDLMNTVSPRSPNRWRHVPAALLLVAIALLTVAAAEPTQDVRLPRNRAVIMLVIDVSQSMRATDEPPSRLAAAQKAAKEFAAHVTPGVNLGLIAFAGTPNLLVSPTPQHEATIAALDNLQPADRTATGEALFTALQSIATVAAVVNQAAGTAVPARIVLLSDGKETSPDNPNSPRGAYTAARTAKDQGVPVSTIAFGTKGGSVGIDNQRVPVPVDEEMMRRIALLSGGQFYRATNVDELSRSYSLVQEQIGFQFTKGPASAGWLRLAVLFAIVATGLAVIINRRLPT